MPKRVSTRLEEPQFLALIEAASAYLEQLTDSLGPEATRTLDAHLRGSGRMDFAFVKGLDLEPHLLDQAQTYFSLELALRQLQADVDRLRGQQ